MSGDYEVGYRKPPRHTRFRPGRSGNPRGRPRKARSLAEDLSEEVQERIALGEDAAAGTVSKQRALLKSLMDRAIGGDAKAASMILDLVQQLVGAQAYGPGEYDDPNREDPRERLARKITQIRHRMIAHGVVPPEPGEVVPGYPDGYDPATGPYRPGGVGAAAEGSPVTGKAGPEEGR